MPSERSHDGSPLPRWMLVVFALPGVALRAGSFPLYLYVPALYAEDFVKQAVEAGVSGYLLKDSDSDQITRAVHQVHEGLSPIAPSLTRGLVTEFAKLSRSSRSSVLTQRQVEILKLVSEGESGKTIGERLYLSTSTVKREVRHIFDKLGVNDRAHAVSEAMKRNLI